MRAPPSVQMLKRLLLRQFIKIKKKKQKTKNRRKQANKQTHFKRQLSKKKKGVCANDNKTTQKEHFSSSAFLPFHLIPLAEVTEGT